jgi:hypothetical protein
VSNGRVSPRGPTNQTESVYGLLYPLRFSRPVRLT